jgi:sucrose-6-phosphate hydrolase SacC (GH32 family)
LPRSGHRQAGRARSAPQVPPDTIPLFIDAAFIEAFADGGANVLTDTFFPTRPFRLIAVYAQGQRANLLGGEAYGLRSIWISNPSNPVRIH